MKKLFIVIILGSFSLVTADQYQQYQSNSGYYNPNATYQSPTPQYYYQPSTQQSSQDFQPTYSNSSPQYPQYAQPNIYDNQHSFQNPSIDSSNSYQPNSGNQNRSNYYQPSSPSNINNSASRPGQLASNIRVNIHEEDKIESEDAALPETSSDDHISKKIHEVLYEYISKDSQNVAFEFEDGIVTLTGYVNSQEAKDRIDEQLKKIKGIKKIDNQIVVADTKKFAYYQPPVATNNSALKTSTKPGKDYAALDKDKKINAAIREKLDRNDFVGVSIITANGVVTLAGTVDDSDKFVPFLVEIEKVEGVKKVNNKVSSKK